jgi:beta-galactosidase/beta-glucuronidase
MSNRIRNVHVVNHRLDPHETELRIIVEVEELTPTTQIKGRLMGPRNVYRSTVEVAYPLREVEHADSIVLRVVIPEASWWEPKTPFLYQGPLELWQDGILCDRRDLSHGIRNLQAAANGWRLNGRPFILRGQAVELPFDETQARQWHDDGINTLLTGIDKHPSDSDLGARADHFGFFVMDDDRFASMARVVPSLG